MIALLTFFSFMSPFNAPIGLVSAEALEIEVAKATKKLEKIEYQKMRVSLAREAVTILKLKKAPDKMYSGLSANQTTAIVEIHKAFGPEHFTDAVRIAYCESRLDPGAVNRANRNKTVDRGLFQLNDGGTMQRLGVTAKEAFNPKINAAAAKILFEDRGWQPWSCQYVYGILDKYKKKP
jgi:hypothetical protein